MDSQKKKKRRFKSFTVLFLVSILMLFSIVPAFAAPVQGSPVITYTAVPPSTILEVKPESSNLNGNGYFTLSLKKGQTLSTGKVFSTTIKDTNDRVITSSLLYYYDRQNTMNADTVKDCITNGTLKLVRADGTTLSSSDIELTGSGYNNYKVHNINSTSLTIEWYVLSSIVHSGGTNSDVIMSIGAFNNSNLSNFQVVQAPLFNLTTTSLSVTQSSDTVKVSGTITDGYSGAVIQYRVNNGTWISGGSTVNHDGYGKFDITLNNSIFTSTNNLVDVRIQSDDGIFSLIKTCTVTNNFLENPNPDPDPNPDPGNPDPGTGSGGSGTIKINFNVADMFKHGNSVIVSFMGILAVIVGIAVGFRVVFFIKDLF